MRAFFVAAYVTLYGRLDSGAILNEAVVPRHFTAAVKTSSISSFVRQPVAGC
jgi:hypothetical protein